MLWQCFAELCTGREAPARQADGEAGNLCGWPVDGRKWGGGPLGGLVKLVGFWLASGGPGEKQGPQLDVRVHGLRHGWLVGWGGGCGGCGKRPSSCHSISRPLNHPRVVPLQAGLSGARCCHPWPRAEQQAGERAGGDQDPAD